MDKLKILGIIPARGGSKRIPGKNKKKLAEKELVRYSIESCIESKLLTNIILSSDDSDILEIGKQYQGIKTLTRPEEISGDNSLAITFVKHALSVLDDNSIGIVVIIQPSSPFTTGYDIDETITLLLNDPLADSAVSVVKLDHSIHPAKLKTMVNGKLTPFFEEEKGKMAAHELPIVYVRNGSVYATRISSILKNQIIGNNCLGYEMSRERSLDINDSLDFEFAEFLKTKKA